MTVSRQSVAEAVRDIWPNDVDSLMTATAPELYQMSDSFFKVARFSILPDVTARLFAASIVAFVCAKFAEGKSPDAIDLKNLMIHLRFHGVERKIFV